MHATRSRKVREAMKDSNKMRVQRILVYAGVVAVLLAVFALYTRPDFLITLADQVWSCF